MASMRTLPSTMATIQNNMLVIVEQLSRLVVVYMGLKMKQRKMKERNLILNLRLSPNQNFFDEVIEPEKPQVPLVRAGPRTRSGTRVLREEFNKAVRHLLNLHQPILDASDQEQADCNKIKLFNIQDGPSINLSLLTAHSTNKESTKELTMFTILPTV